MTRPVFEYDYLREYRDNYKFYTCKQQFKNNSFYSVEKCEEFSYKNIKERSSSKVYKYICITAVFISNTINRFVNLVYKSIQCAFGRQ